MLLVARELITNENGKLLRTAISPDRTGLNDLILLGKKR